MYHFDEARCLDWFRQMIAIDSTTSQFREIQDWLCGKLDEMGFAYHVTRKGGVIVELGGEGRPLCVTAHLDDIGLMVRRVNPDGTLNVCPVGGLYPFYCVTENVRVHTRDGKVYTGTICRVPNSIHVTEEELRAALPDFRTNVAVVLDEDVRSAADTRALGIETGDMIALEPRFTVSNGYIKSRFIDDKAAAAVLLCAMEDIRDGKIRLKRKVYAYFAMYEEIGHGTSYCPDALPLGDDERGPPGRHGRGGRFRHGHLHTPLRHRRRHHPGGRIRRPPCRHRAGHLQFPRLRAHPYGRAEKHLPPPGGVPRKMRGSGEHTRRKTGAGPLRLRSCFG